MNEMHSWTFKRHNVVRQKNSGVVEDFILLYSAAYLRIQKWKNYWNRSTFAKVIVKIKVARFLWTTVYTSRSNCLQQYDRLQNVSGAHVGDLVLWILEEGTGWGTGGIPWKTQLDVPPFSWLESHTQHHAALYKLYNWLSTIHPDSLAKMHK